jgi:hypothetical protein
MASDSTAEVYCDFYSRSNFDLSDPFQHAHQCYLTSHADPKPISSKDHLITLRELGSYEHEERTAVERSKTEQSADSSSLASSGNPRGVQTIGWRPSFFRGGPLVGLTVCMPHGLP